MTVITISREFGSGGDLLAEKVAHALGYHLVDKAFVSAVLGQYGLSEFDSEYEKQPGFWEGFDTEKAERRDTMVRMLNQVVRAVARHGNVVILGRSGAIQQRSALRPPGLLRFARNDGVGDDNRRPPC